MIDRKAVNKYLALTGEKIATTFVWIIDIDDKVTVERDK